ncbi:MAG: NADH-quinone oxidoreductase subunit C [Candidatus Hodarchaeales archaeon]
MSIESHLRALKDQFGIKLQKAEIIESNRISITVSPDDLIQVMNFIASELGFTSLESISGLDWETHFEVVYHVDKWDGDPTVIQINVPINNREKPEVPTITTIWRSANWHERELWDLFGINVKDHPNLKRLLLPEEWDEFEHKHISELYPMRKAYKLPEKPFSFKPQPK